MSGPPAPTKSQVNKAGKMLRRAHRGEGLSIDEYRFALDTLLAFRAAHGYPLTKATMGLRSMVSSEDCPVRVSQRLKRVPTILDKLYREPTMQLATMQDVGGCRALLATVGDVRRVQKRLTKRRPPLRVTDYIINPRESGYRGVHVIVEYDGRAIEVQLRTRVMHEWAFTVERLGSRIHTDLKSGRGPAELLEWLEVVSEAMALQEAGEEVDPTLDARIMELRAKALPFLTGGTP